MTINKKIAASALTIGAAGAMLVGATFALFSDTANVGGVTLTTGNADLKINGQDSLNAPALLAGPAYPGWVDGQQFTLSNTSTSPIGLNVTARLTSATGNWAELNNVVEVAVIEYTDSTQRDAALTANDPGSGTTVANTGWQALAIWNASPIAIGATLSQGENNGNFVIWGRIPSSAGNEIQNKTVAVDFELVGTQAP